MSSGLLTQQSIGPFSICLIALVVAILQSCGFFLAPQYEYHLFWGSSEDSEDSEDSGDSARRLYLAGHGFVRGNVAAVGSRNSSCEAFFSSDGRSPAEIPQTWGEARAAFREVCEQEGPVNFDCQLAEHIMFKRTPSDLNVELSMGDNLCDGLMTFLDALLTVPIGSNSNENSTVRLNQFLESFEAQFIAQASVRRGKGGFPVIPAVLRRGKGYNAGSGPPRAIHFSPAIIVATSGRGSRSRNGRRRSNRRREPGTEMRELWQFSPNGVVVEPNEDDMVEYVDITYSEICANYNGEEGYGFCSKYQAIKAFGVIGTIFALLTWIHIIPVAFSDMNGDQGFLQGKQKLYRTLLTFVIISISLSSVFILLQVLLFDSCAEDFQSTVLKACFEPDVCPGQIPFADSTVGDNIWGQSHGMKMAITVLIMNGLILPLAAFLRLWKGCNEEDWIIDGCIGCSKRCRCGRKEDSDNDPSDNPSVALVAPVGNVIVSGAPVVDGIPCMNGNVIVGSRVKKQKWAGQEDTWLKGTVTAISPDGTATLAGDDGSTWTGDASRIQLINLVDEQHAFLNAAEGGNLEKVKEFLSANPFFINVQPNGRSPALHACAMKGHKEAVEFLLDKRADTQLVNSEGKTAADVADKSVLFLLTGEVETPSPDVRKNCDLGAAEPPPDADKAMIVSAGDTILVVANWLQGRNVVELFDDAGDILFHWSARRGESTVVRNAHFGGWGAEERSGGWPFMANLDRLAFKLTASVVEVSVNGERLTSFDFAYRTVARPSRVGADAGVFIDIYKAPKRIPANGLVFSIRACQSTSDSIVDSVTGVTIGGKPITTHEGYPCWDLDNDYLERTGETNLQEGQYYTHAVWVYWRSNDDGWRTLMRPSDDHSVLIQNGAKNLGMFSNRGGNAFKDCGYEITEDMSSWQLVVVTGSSDEPDSSTGTSTFYTAAEGQNTMTNRGTADGVVCGTTLFRLGWPGQGPGKVAAAHEWNRVLSEDELAQLLQAGVEAAAS